MNFNPVLPPEFAYRKANIMWRGEGRTVEWVGYKAVAGGEEVSEQFAVNGPPDKAQKVIDEQVIPALVELQPDPVDAVKEQLVSELADYLAPSVTSLEAGPLLPRAMKMMLAKQQGVEANLPMQQAPAPIAEAPKQKKPLSEKQRAAIEKMRAVRMAKIEARRAAEGAAA